MRRCLARRHAPRPRESFSTANRDVVAVKTKLRYTTLIVLPKNEQILDFTCGDKEFWVVNGNQNFAYVKPAKAGARNQSESDHRQRQHLLVRAGRSLGGAEAGAGSQSLRRTAETNRCWPRRAPRRSLFPRRQLDDYRQQVEIAKEETRQVKQAAQAAIDSGISQFVSNVRFPYRFEAGKKPFFVRAMYHDDKFTYIQARPEETPTLYEIKDGKPNLVNFDYKDGVYVVDKILDQGYLAIGKREARLYARGVTSCPINNPTPRNVPQVTDRRRKIDGLLPKNAQARVLGGIALVMVVIIMLSGRNAPKERPCPSRRRPLPRSMPIRSAFRSTATQIEEQARETSRRRSAIGSNQADARAFRRAAAPRRRQQCRLSGNRSRLARQSRVLPRAARRKIGWSGSARNASIRASLHRISPCRTAAAPRRLP